MEQGGMRKVIEEILAEMKRQKITQRDMADMIGISPATFTTRAKGEADFHASDIEKMCIILGYDVVLQPSTERLVHPEKWRRPYKGV